jgi:hypothetical protein
MIKAIIDFFKSLFLKGEIKNAKKEFLSNDPVVAANLADLIIRNRRPKKEE